MNRTRPLWLGYVDPMGKYRTSLTPFLVGTRMLYGGRGRPLDLAGQFHRLHLLRSQLAVTSRRREAGAHLFLYRANGCARLWVNPSSCIFWGVTDIKQDTASTTDVAQFDARKTSIIILTRILRRRKVVHGSRFYSQRLIGSFQIPTVPLQRLHLRFVCFCVFCFCHHGSFSPGGRGAYPLRVHLPHQKPLPW